MAKLIQHQKQNNKILSVTMQMTGSAEIDVYQKFMDAESLDICPYCKSSIDKTKVKGMYILIHNPSESDEVLGFYTGIPYVACPNCGREIRMSMMDIAPFTGIVNWLKQLKEKVKEKQTHGTEKE